MATPIDRRLSAEGRAAATAYLERRGAATAAVRAARDRIPFYPVRGWRKTPEGAAVYAAIAAAEAVVAAIDAAYEAEYPPEPTPAPDYSPWSGGRAGGGADR